MFAALRTRLRTRLNSRTINSPFRDPARSLQPPLPRRDLSRQARTTREVAHSKGRAARRQTYTTLKDESGCEESGTWDRRRKQSGGVKDAAIAAKEGTLELCSGEIGVAGESKAKAAEKEHGRQ